MTPEQAQRARARIAAAVADPANSTPQGDREPATYVVSADLWEAISWWFEDEMDLETQGSAMSDRPPFVRMKASRSVVQRVPDQSVRVLTRRYYQTMREAGLSRIAARNAVIVSLGMGRFANIQVESHYDRPANFDIEPGEYFETTCELKPEVEVEGW